MPKVVDEQMREATRRRIMHEAASEFARLGFDQANINTIAEQAGIGKGTIYLYFENKRDLFLEMLRYIAQAQLASIRVALAAEGTLQQRLERLFRAFAHLAEEESDNFNVYMSALYGVNRAFQAEATNFVTHGSLAFTSPPQLLYYVVLGLLCGLIGLLYARGFYGITHRF